MKQSEVHVGKVYLAKVNGKLTQVRLDKIVEQESRCYGSYKVRASVSYYVTNLRTGRKTTFRSAVKFRGPAEDPRDKYPTPNIEELSAQLRPDDRIDRSGQPKKLLN